MGWLLKLNSITEAGMSWECPRSSPRQQLPSYWRPLRIASEGAKAVVSGPDWAWLSSACCSRIQGFCWVYISQLQIEQFKELDQWTQCPSKNHGSQVRCNTNDLQLERKGSSCTGPMVQWSIPQREEGGDLQMLKQETGIEYALLMEILIR